MAFKLQKSQRFAGSGFLNLQMCCFSLSFMTVNEESLGFGLWVGQKKQHVMSMTSVFGHFYRLNQQINR